MYITAQRVLSHQSKTFGVNAFLYLHPSWPWPGHPPPDAPETEPGQFERHILQITPLGGNKVVSYLDVIAPDEVPTNELKACFARFLELGPQTELPWNLVAGKARFRFGIDERLTPVWDSEIDRLFRAVLGVLSGDAGSTW